MRAWEIIDYCGMQWVRRRGLRFGKILEGGVKGAGRNEMEKTSAEKGFDKGWAQELWRGIG